MIIEKNTQTENIDYKIYELVEMTDAEGNAVNVKQLKRTVRKEDVEQRISQLTTEIERLQAEKTSEESILTEINKLK